MLKIKKYSINFQLKLKYNLDLKTKLKVFEMFVCFFLSFIFILLLLF